MAEPQLKKLTLREVARRFEQGDESALEDYRVHNLHESTAQSSQALQETLRSMPVARNVIQDMLKVTKDLSGRVAGRNSDDAAQISAGLIHLLDHLQSYEVSTVQAAKELANSSALGMNSTSKSDCIPAVLMPTQIQSGPDRVAEMTQKCSDLEQRCTLLQHEHVAQAAQIAERDATILSLRQQMESRTRSELDHKSNGIARDKLSSSLTAESAVSSDEEHSGAAASAVATQKESATSLPAPDGFDSKAAHSALKSLSIGGRLEVGGTLHIGQSDANGTSTLPFESIQLQWLRTKGGASPYHVISGAIRQQYSPEPADIGCMLHCRVGWGNVYRTVSCSEPITASPELEQETDRLAVAAAAGEAASFVVVPVQHNGTVQRRRSVAMLSVSTSGVTLQSGDTGGESAVAPFHVDMQVCGARGGGDGAAQGLFLAMSSQHVFMLALETPTKRNTCILFLRKMAGLQGLQLEGPVEM